MATRKKCSEREAIREAIRLAADDDFTRKIADRLEAIEQRLADDRMTKNIQTLSSQLCDMAEANKANTDRIATLLKAIFERVKQ